MTVAELIAELQKCDPAAIVVLASDEEGNAFAELYDVAADQGWDPDSRELYSEDGIAPSNLDAVCLWP